MICLKKKGMPNAILVDGMPFFLDTDYRKWLDFPQRVNTAISQHDYSGYNELFLDENNIPPFTNETVEELKLFHHQESLLPRDKESVNVIDYDLDADLIYSSFMQAYGIDVVEEDMHWHKFITLLGTLPSNTTLQRIISYRLYEGDDKDIKKLKQSWLLPQKLTEEEKEAVEKFDRFFG